MMTCVQPTVAQHRRRDLAGERPLGLPVQVLRGEQHAAARAGTRPPARAREGRRDQDLAAGDVARRRSIHGARAARASAPRAVHLPVAGEQRDAVRSCVRSSAASPGSVPPSRNSSEAPPPVEMWVMALGACPSASPPPPSRRRRRCWSRRLSASASAIAIVPAANGATSKMPIGPFQKTVRAVRDLGAEALARSRGPMSSPILPAGNRLRTVVVGAPARASLGDHVVDRQHAGRTPRCARLREQLAGHADLVLLDQRLARLLPLRRAGTCTPSRRRSGARRRASSRLSMTAILSETLAPPRIATNGRSGARQHLAEVLALALQQEAGRRARATKRHHADGRGVRAVRGAEGVVDVDVGEARQRARELLVVLLLLGVEAQVLEQHDLARRAARRPAPRRRRRRSRAPAAPVAPRSSPSAARDRRQAERRVRACPSAGRGARRGRRAPPCSRA